MANQLIQTISSSYSWTRNGMLQSLYKNTGLRAKSIFKINYCNIAFGSSAFAKVRLTCIKR